MASFLLIKVLNKHKISWSITGGTLLGLIRHNGLISWDDDIDICVDIEDIGKLYCLRKELQNKKYKLFNIAFDDATLIKLKNNKVWIDIFFIEDNKHISQYKYTNSRWDYKENEYKPFKEGLFGDLKVYIPNKSKEYLDRIYPKWDTHAVIQNHSTAKKTISKKYSLNKNLLKPYLPTKMLCVPIEENK